MKTITKNELVELLKQVRGTTFVSISSEVTPQLKGGKSCPLQGVVKKSESNCTIGFKWQNSVNNQLEREGEEPDFIAEPRKWGVRLTGTPLVKHKDSYYLETKVEKSHAEYFMDGKEIDKEEIKPYLRDTSSITEKPLYIRDYSIDSIKSIRINGESYNVI